MSVDILSFRIELPDIAKKLVGYTLTRLEHHYHVKICISDQGAITVGTTSEVEIKVSQKLVRAILDRQFSHSELFVDQPLIFDEHGHADHLGTATYMLHYLQEFSTSPDDFDELDRFKYSRTYQSKFNCAERNLVLEYLIELVNTTPSLRGIKRTKKPSRLFVTHDIDILHHSIWPELKTACRNLRVDHILSLLFVESMRNTDERLFQSILNINSKNGIEATFFWMTSNKPVSLASGDKIENSNYSVHSLEVKKLLRLLRQKKQTIGIHKSIGDITLKEEVEALNTDTLINRNHYLHGKLDETLSNAKKNRFVADCSAGFSSEFGFRNSYGLPSKLFNFEEGKHIDVLEIPLNIMDMHIAKREQTFGEECEKVFKFIQHNRTDCVLSILWHNNYFSNYKYSRLFSLYKDMIAVCQQTRIVPINYQELVNDFQ